MAQTGRRRLSVLQKKEFWERWRRGQSASDIARAFTKQRGSSHSILSVSDEGVL